MPLRDDRRGRRATLGSGKAPLRPDFSSASGSPAGKPVGFASDNLTPVKPVGIASDDLTPVKPFGIASDDLTPVKPFGIASDDLTAGKPFGIASDNLTPVKPAGIASDDLTAGKPFGIASDDLTAKTQSDAIRKQADVCDDQPLLREAFHSFDVLDASHTPSDAHEVDRNGSSLAASSVAAFTDELANAPSAATQPRSLLEPAAVLRAIASPFFRFASAVADLVDRPIVGSSVHTQEPANEDARSAVIVERSFANEVASLLRAPAEELTLPERPREASSPLDNAAKPFVLHESSGATKLDLFAAVYSVSSDAPRTDAPRNDTSAAADASGCDRAAEERESGDSVYETQNAVKLEDASALRFDVRQSGPAEKRDGIVSEAETDQNIVVARVRLGQERAVPITRLPLRPQGFDITWTGEVPDHERSRSLSRTARHDLLERLIRNPGTVSSDAIVRAYHQEEGEGRAIALRVLLRNFPQAGRSAFVEALRVGSDEERALAIDGLTAIGAREEMTPAFSDRVDAIAAKAALSYVGTLERADYRAALSPFIDEMRIEAILSLLAGIIE